MVFMIGSLTIQAINVIIYFIIRQNLDNQALESNPSLKLQMLPIGTIITIIQIILGYACTLMMY
jgi:hypothetical protein